MHKLDNFFSISQTTKTISMSTKIILKCPECEKTFQTKTWLTKHTEKKHLEESSDLQKPSFKCGYCKKGYTNHTWLLKHIWKNHEEAQTLHQTQRANFRKSHSLGEHSCRKKRNTVCSQLEGQKVRQLRKSGTSQEISGRNEGEAVFTTRTPIKYRGSGQEDLDEMGENVMIFLGVSDGKNVSAIHMRGPGDLLEDGHVVMEGDVFSQIQGPQSQTLHI